MPVNLQLNINTQTKETHTHRQTHTQRWWWVTVPPHLTQPVQISVTSQRPDLTPQALLSQRVNTTVCVRVEQSQQETPDSLPININATAPLTFKTRTLPVLSFSSPFVLSLCLRVFLPTLLFVFKHLRFFLLQRLQKFCMKILSISFWD